MLKKSLIVASLLLAGTSVMAQSYFVGIDYGNYDNTATFSAAMDGESYSDSGSDKDKNIGLKVGIADIANGRIYLHTGKLYDNKEDGFSMEYKSTSINYDYFIGQYGKVTPFVGVAIGQGELSWNIYEEDGFSLSASGKAIEYGAKLGALVKVTKNANFEIGYTYGKSNADATLTNPENSNEYIKIEADDTQGLYVGFNYIF